MEVPRNWCKIETVIYARDNTGN